MTQGNATGPLLLMRGDPLPELPVEGFEQSDWNDGTWMLLAVDKKDCVDGLIEMVAAQTGRTGKAVNAVFFIVGGEITDWDIIADPDGVAARRLGALVGENELHPLAVLVDPRGRVYASATGTDTIDAARRAMDAIASP